jgi:hypothetical protein
VGTFRLIEQTFECHDIVSNMWMNHAGGLVLHGLDALPESCGEGAQGCFGLILHVQLWPSMSSHGHIRSWPSAACTAGYLTFGHGWLCFSADHMTGVSKLCVFGHIIDSVYDCRGLYTPYDYIGTFHTP